MAVAADPRWDAFDDDDAADASVDGNACVDASVGACVDDVTTTTAAVVPYRSRRPSWVQIACAAAAAVADDDDQAVGLA